MNLTEAIKQKIEHLEQLKTQCVTAYGKEVADKAIERWKEINRQFEEGEVTKAMLGESVASCTLIEPNGNMSIKLCRNPFQIYVRKTLELERVLKNGDKSIDEEQIKELGKMLDVEFGV